MVTMALSLVAVRLVRRDLLAPWVVGLVVLAPTTLLAVPELGRFGARPDNPTLLDRPYWVGWWAVAGIVLAGVVLATVRRGRRERTLSRGGDDDGTSTGGR
jgi:hypothetical protein